jgi:hypothetical protein
MPTSLKQGNQLLIAALFRQGMPGRGASESVFVRESSAFHENLSSLHFQLPTLNFQLIAIHQPITGHFRQKGARRYLPDLKPSRAFGPGLEIQTEKPGVFNNPFSDRPGVGTSMPISNWVGIADGLQAIPNLQSQNLKSCDSKSQISNSRSH